MRRLKEFHFDTDIGGFTVSLVLIAPTKKAFKQAFGISDHDMREYGITKGGPPWTKEAWRNPLHRYVLMAFPNDLTGFDPSRFTPPVVMPYQEFQKAVNEYNNKFNPF